MKIIDRYIIVKYISTFLVMLVMFIPVGIMVDMAENRKKTVSVDMVDMEQKLAKIRKVDMVDMND